MKIRRILSVFFLTGLLCSLLVTPAWAVEEPTVNAKAALLMDTEGDIVLFEKNAHQQMYPASITKVMTALLILEAVEQGKLQMDQMITASATAFFDMEADGSTAGIVTGESMSVQDLLYCLLLESANEVGNILAEAVSGSVSAFVQLMNQKAAELGMEDTHFANTHGLHNPQHYTTAWDLYLLAREAIGNEAFMTICNTLSYTVPATNKSGERELHTTNSLISNWRILGYLYDGAEGIKTGTTEQAGNCLLSSAVRGSRRLVCVVLGCDGEGTEIQSFTDSARLYDYGFDNFSLQTIITADEMIQEVPVDLSTQTNYVVVHPAQDVQALLPNDVDVSQLERKVELTRDVALAPIAAGDQLGTLTFLYDGEVCATVPLLAQFDVSASRFLTAKYQIEQFLSKTVVQIVLVILVLAVVLVWVWWKFFRRNRRYGRSSGRRHGRRAYRGRRR